MLLLFDTNDLPVFNSNLAFELPSGNGINNNSLALIYGDSLQPQMYKYFKKVNVEKFCCACQTNISRFFAVFQKEDYSFQWGTAQLSGLKTLLKITRWTLRIATESIIKLMSLQISIFLNFCSYR
jgi:hypothetical protein